MAVRSPAEDEGLMLLPPLADGVSDVLDRRFDFVRVPMTAEAAAPFVPLGAWDEACDDSAAAAEEDEVNEE